MSEVNLMVRISVKEDSVDVIKVAMRKLQELTLADPGCELYQFYQDRKSPAMFYVQERYSNKESFHSHGNSPHMAAYLSETKDMVESVNLHKVDRI